jgi:hypothetical protein
MTFEACTPHSGALCRLCWLVYLNDASGCPLGCCAVRRALSCEGWRRLGWRTCNHFFVLTLLSPFHCMLCAGCADGCPLSLVQLCEDLPHLADYQETGQATWTFLTAIVSTLAAADPVVSVTERQRKMHLLSQVDSADCRTCSPPTASRQASELVVTRSQRLKLPCLSTKRIG